MNLCMRWHSANMNLHTRLNTSACEGANDLPRTAGDRPRRGTLSPEARPLPPVNELIYILSKWWNVTLSREGRSQREWRESAFCLESCVRNLHFNAPRYCRWNKFEIIKHPLPCLSYYFRHKIFFLFFCCFWFSVVHITLEKGLINITLILNMYLASQYSKATETVQGTANNNEPHAQETRTKMGNKPE